MPYSYIIHYSDNSISDLKEISSYYSDISSALTERFKYELLRTEADILTNPFAFSKTNFQDFRRAIIKRFPYKIIYRVSENIIQVFAIIHFARSNKYVKGRLR